jgi:hypothetical protein
MAALLALALLDAAADLPRSLSAPLQEEKGAVKSKEEVFAVEAFVLRTSFDDGLHLDEGLGAGAEFNFRWQYGGKTRMGFSVGVAGWDTETDIDGLPDQDVDIAQYRAGFGAEFPFSKIEIGLGVNLGVYRFRADGEGDTSPFLEFEGSLGFRPIPELKIGGLVLATHTQSSFGRSHTHLFHNYSAGLGVEWSF